MLILRWLLPLWLLGWLVLPLARRIFVNLPDSGLAAGRTLAIALLSLLAFWGASLHLLSLALAPVLMVGLPLLCGALTLGPAASRGAFLQWAGERKRALIVSDLIFLTAFTFFLWIRLRHPEINDLEKSMDAALIAALERTRFLPAESPWFSGHDFTNYYYFGHLMGALLARTFGTPVVYAYNLIQPLFCALFIAPLWSLCAALTGSLRRGTVAMCMIALCGHFEPLRQWSHADLSVAQNLFRLDWWSTSRVITDTINEYPIFTLSIGDAHGHFFALSLAATFFCGCYALFASVSSAPAAPEPLFSSLPWLHPRRAVLLILGCLLGILWMTNTWDLPLYGTLALVCAIWTLPFWPVRQTTSSQTSPPPAIADEPITPAKSGKKSKPKGQKPKTQIQNATNATATAQPPMSSATPQYNLAQKVEEILWTLAPLPIARLIAIPYLRLFTPQFTGAVREFYSPSGYEFLLLWGGFLALWLLALAARNQKGYGIPALIIIVAALLFGRSYLAMALVIATLALTVLGIISTGLPLESETTATERTTEPPQFVFEKLIALFGLLALLGPMLFYIKGAFGDGQFRHMDTFFKFGLQSWLMLGIAATCGAITAFCTLLHNRPAWQWGGRIVWAALWSIPVMCAVCVVWTRTVRDASRDPQGNFILSLDAAHDLPIEDHQAMEWLQRNAREGDSVLEAVSRAPDGTPNGDFVANYGRVSALTGVPTPVGWPQHIAGWGASWDEIRKRADAVKRVYDWPDNTTGFEALRQLGVHYVFVGATERHDYKPDALARLRAAMPGGYDGGTAFIAEVPDMGAK